MRLGAMLLATGLAALAVGCGPSDEPAATTASINGGENGVAAAGAPAETTLAVSTAAPTTSSSAGAAAARSTRQAVELHPVMMIKTSLGDITVQLDAENAPMTVENFAAYVEEEYYGDTIFHYVEQGYMISAGGYRENGESNETRAYVLNEAHNGLKNTRGTIAMARDPQYKHSAAAQFFINLVDNPALDHQSDESDEAYGYCVFGKVIEGMEVVDQIAGVPVTDDEVFVKRPTQPVLIHSIERVR